MAIRVLVADDEALARNELIYLLQKAGEVKVVGEAANGEEAVRLARETKPDVVFLDVQMPKLDGLRVAAELIEDSNHPLIVFATAYDAHAIKAFEVNAVDYLLKPFEEERVKITVRRIEEGLNRLEAGKLSRLLSELIRQDASGAKESGVKPRLMKIAVQEEDRVFFLDPQEIVYIYREGREVLIKTGEREFASKFSLNHLEEKLRGYPFLRTHRAYLVNLDRIEQMVPWFNGSYTLIMKDQKRSQVPVSRMYVKELKEHLGFV